MRHFRALRQQQRGYAAIPYIASFFTAGASASAGAAVAGGASALGGVAAGAGAGVAAAGAAGAAAYTGAALYAGSKVLQPKMPTFSTPAIPTLDQAAQQRQIQDRILRRRGVLANIYAGNATGGAPTVGTAKLLGG